MSSAQKTPFARAMSAFAQGKALDEIAKLGLALPGSVAAMSGAIVTINFEVQGLTLPKVQMPVASPEYVRYPIQVGDKGLAVPGSVYLGGVSGLGGGTADDSLRGNLATLYWQPLTNKNWTAPPGANADTLALYGHLSLLLLDSLTGNSSVKLTSTGITLAFGTGTLTMDASGITMTVGGHSIVINSTGVTIDGKVFLLHDHLPGTFVAGATAVTGISGPVL